jgi:hypothetical protein
MFTPRTWGAGRRMLQVIDCHAAGEAARVVIGGLPRVPGATMLAKREHMRSHMDSLRKLLLLEPRGYPCQNANFVFPSQHPDAEFGFVIAEQGQWPGPLPSLSLGPKQGQRPGSLLSPYLCHKLGSVAWQSSTLWSEQDYVRQFAARSRVQRPPPKPCAVTPRNASRPRAASRLARSPIVSGQSRRLARSRPVSAHLGRDFPCTFSEKSRFSAPTQGASTL